MTESLTVHQSQNVRSRWKTQKAGAPALAFCVSKAFPAKAELRAHIRWGAWIIAQGSRRDRSRRSRWCGPRNRVEVEEIEQIGLRRISRSEMRGAADEPILDEFDDRGMVHRDVRNVVTPGEGRNNHIRHPEAELGRVTFYGGGITGMGSRAARFQVAVKRRSSA